MGKLFDEADCDGEAAAFQAGASENIQHAWLPAVYPCLPRACVLLARTRRLPTALGGRQAAWRDGVRRGEVAARQLAARSARRLTARQPRCGSWETAALRLGETGARQHGEMATRPLPARRCTAAHGDSSRRDSRTAQAGGGAGRWRLSSERPHREMAARPLPGETAAGARDAWRGGRTAGRPRGNESSGRGSIRGLSPNSHGETAARRLRGSSARRLGETSARRDGHAARQRDCRRSKHPRGETAAWRLHGESECIVSRAVAARAVAARRDGRMARRPRINESSGRGKHSGEVSSRISRSQGL